MALFAYRATDKNNKIIEGTIGAKSRDEAADIIRKKDLQPLTIKDLGGRTKSTGKLPMVEKITFCRYMSAMLKSGLSLSRGVEVLQEETKHPLMKKILGDILYNLERGRQLSFVFSQYPDVFDQFFLTLIEVGEISGTLGDVFSYLEEGLRAQYSLSQKVKGALLYPAVVFSAMLAIGFLMFFFVLPQIGKVFLSMKLPLPFATTTLFRLSFILSQNMIPIVIGLITTVVALIIFLRRRSGQKILLSLISPFPLVSDLIRQTDLARFTRIFSTLLISAVPITQALDIAIAAFSYHPYQRAGEIIKKNVIGGKTLAESVKEQKVFPPLLVQMIAAGEKTGTLDKTLADLASFYEEKIEEEVKDLTQVLEPVLILIVGIAVGAMVLSIIAPIYSVVSSLQQGISQ